MTGELGTLTEYLYWSERRVARLARENGIRLTSRKSVAVKADVGIVPKVQLETTDHAGELTLNEKSKRIEVAVGQLAVEDFVTPPSVRFAKGRTAIAVSQYFGAEARPGMMFHVRTQSSKGQRVDVILFGSMDNVPEYMQKAEVLDDGWTSSAMPFIEDFLRSHGTRWDHYDFPDGPSHMAIDALQIALHQGSTTPYIGSRTVLKHRGYTLDQTNDAEWFARIYLDVEVDPQRWGLSAAEFTERILIGAPLWIRTPLGSPTFKSLLSRPRPRPQLRP